jgi:hypothetical protein
VSRVGYA